jgi:hypothetical protein
MILKHNSPLKTLGPQAAQLVCEWFTEWTPKIYLAFKERIKGLVEPEVR